MLIQAPDPSLLRPFLAKRVECVSKTSVALQFADSTSLLCQTRSDIAPPLSVDAVLACPCHHQEIAGTPSARSRHPIEPLGPAPTPAGILRDGMTGQPVDLKKIVPSVRLGHQVFPSRLNSQPSTASHVLLRVVHRSPLASLSQHVLSGIPLLLMPATEGAGSDDLQCNRERLMALAQALSHASECLIVSTAIDLGPRVPLLQRFFAVMSPTGAACTDEPVLLLKVWNCVSQPGDLFSSPPPHLKEVACSEAMLVAPSNASMALEVPREPAAEHSEAIAALLAECPITPFSPFALRSGIFDTARALLAPRTQQQLQLHPPPVQGGGQHPLRLKRTQQAPQPVPPRKSLRMADDDEEE